MLLKTVFYITILTKIVLAIPPNDKALYDNPESRIHKRRRPCRGRTPDGRTFFDWSLQYVDVNYNYNYNINCGGGGNGQHGGGGNGQHGGGGGPQKPILSGLLQGDNGGGGSQHPVLSGVLQGGNVVSGGDHPENGLFGSNGPITFVQSQVQGILANPPNFGSVLPQNDGTNGGGGLGSWFPSGLFNGQGILSLFENGLFSGIFDNNRPSNPSFPSSPSRPPSVPSRPPSVPSRPPVIITTPKPDVQDPDDIIYNDEKPVHEDHDDVFPDQYNRPGQYLVASNPIFGDYVYNLNGNGNGYNRNRITRQFNREINRLHRDFVSLFGI
ncbi:uncharacterized protein LOC135131652 isoform X2 [Zophobas morio]|uniref:uncharacterized protein LOC135131652 isoform X2 n=1 Tax=Zophobas morio TaxID=2755281 RepID=UPI00308307FC